MDIDLNIQKNFKPEVKELFEILAKVAQEKSPQTMVFAVGGFVRDSLLGVPSDDVDIMVYPTSGKDFAYLVTNYLGLKSPHVIKENPEKSKGLETAKTYLKLPSGSEIEVDFAQARADVYDKNSRIPIAKLATPELDAERRDITINAIFYRIYPLPTKIEDFTGKGIKDLISNTIRTPLDPLKTFSDDPLRIWRAVRFAAKYNGEIDPETMAALKNPALKEILKDPKRISQERIGIELAKTFKNPNADKALSLLKETGLFADMLQVSLKGTKYEGKMAELDMNQNNPNHKLTWWGHTMQVVLNTLQKYEGAEPEKKMVMTLAALFHDLGKLFSDIQKKKEGTDKYPGHEQGYTTYIGHEEESAEIATHLLKYLKLDSYVQQIAGLSKYHMQPHSLVRNDESGQKALRKFIRRMGEFSLNWLDVFNLSVADAYSKDKNISPETIAQYQQLENELQAALISMSPTQDTKIEPVLNGNEIMAALNVKPGPHMKEMTEFVKDLKDENPNITKEEAIRKLQEKFWPKPPTPPMLSIPEQPIEKTEKIAGSDKAKTSTCPKHLLHGKQHEIEKLLSHKRFQEATSVIDALRKDYGKDENVARLVALNTLKAILGNTKTRDNNLLTYLFNHAQTNFFDYILGAYVLGILLIIDTGTEDKVIMEVAQRTAKLSPGTLRSVLDIIPAGKIIRKELYEKIKGLL